MNKQEQDEAAARRETQMSGPARQEIEKILQSTIRVYDQIRNIQGAFPYTLEEKQAMLQQLKRHVYGGQDGGES